MQWETLYAARPPYTPRVDHELDTQARAARRALRHAADVFGARCGLPALPVGGACGVRAAAPAAPDRAPPRPPPPQNFERFDEDAAMASPSGSARKGVRADPNFIG